MADRHTELEERLHESSTREAEQRESYKELQVGSR